MSEREPHQQTKHSLIDPSQPMGDCNMCEIPCFKDPKSPSNTHFCDTCTSNLRFCDICEARENPKLLAFETRRIVIKELICLGCRNEPSWFRHFNDYTYQIYRDGFSTDEIKEAVEHIRLQKALAQMDLSKSVPTCEPSTNLTNNSD